MASSALRESTDEDGKIHQDGDITLTQLSLNKHSVARPSGAADEARPLRT